MPNLISLKKKIPAQITHEGAAFGPLNLTEFFVSADDVELSFLAELTDGRSLPDGIICLSEGLISGIPAKKTAGLYQMRIEATHALGETLTTEVDLTIRPRLTIASDETFTKLKAAVWEAIGKNLPAPEMKELLNRPITVAEIYYLLQRFATLTIWDVYNMEPAGERHILTLPDMSSHYDIYDRGSCLVGVPKNLFSHERTLADTLQTARVMAREVYKRGWVIEFVGFNKMVRAAWVELQHLAEEHGKELEILHFSPTPEDIRLFSMEAKSRGIKPSSTV